MHADEQIDDALKRLPSWEPPAAFAPRVITLARVQGWTVREPRARIWAWNVLHGVSAAALASAVSWAVWWSVGPYLRIMTVAGDVMIKQPVALSWTCAAISLLVAAVTTRRALV